MLSDRNTISVDSTEQQTLFITNMDLKRLVQVILTSYSSELFSSGLR